MSWMLRRRAILILLLVLAPVLPVCPRCSAQAALLMEKADGISAFLDPTGHEAVYFARICAATPTKLRRCAPGELGSVITRYQGIAGYDWLAVPLIPYLYSVENPSAVPHRVTHATVRRLRQQYHDAHLLSLGNRVPEGGRLQRGWNQLVGASYQRGTYAFWFRTTKAQDDAFIARMNASANRSHFNILFRNCADFAAAVLDFYFPHVFRRHLAPDAGIVTPRQVAYELVHYARQRPELHLKVFQIPQIPGYRRPSRINQSAAASLIMSGYIVPIALLNLYAAGVIAADGLAWGRYPLPLKDACLLGPQGLAVLASAGLKHLRKGLCSKGADLAGP